MSLCNNMVGYKRNAIKLMLPQHHQQQLKSSPIGCYVSQLFMKQNTFCH